MSPNPDGGRRIITNFEAILIVEKKQFPTYFQFPETSNRLRIMQRIGLNK